VFVKYDCMSDQPISNECPYCHDAMKVASCRCDRCGVEIRGDYPPVPLANLPTAHQRFIEMFVLASGNLKEIATHAGFVNGLARCDESSGDLDIAFRLWKTQEKGSGPPNALTSGIARSLVELREVEEALPYLKRIKAAGGENASNVDAWIAECVAERSPT